MRAAFKFMFLSLMLFVLPKDVRASELDGKVGRWLQVWQSANDEVCEWTFNVLERSIRVDKRPELIGEYFVRWRPLKNPRLRAKGPEKSELASTDLDNDGVEEVLFRVPYRDRITLYGEFLSVLNGSNIEELLEKEGITTNISNLLIKYKISFSMTQGANLYKSKFLPKTDYNGWFRLDASRPSASGRAWKALNGDAGALSLFRVSGTTYLLASQYEIEAEALTKPRSFDAYKRLSSKGLDGTPWAFVLRINPDHTATQICHFQPAGIP